MVVTRSRRTPVREVTKKKVSGKNGDIVDKTDKVDKVDKTAKIGKEGGSKVEKNEKVEKIEKVIKKTEPKPKGRKTSRRVPSRNNSEETDTKKSSEMRQRDVKVYTEGEMKGRKMPAYKIEQLERLQRLIDLSSAAKPRGPITQIDYQKKDNNSNNNNLGIKLLLSKDNKEKVSNITHFDPERKNFLNGTIENDKLNKIIKRYEKIRKFKNIKAPNLTNDKLLKKVLDEVTAKNENLMFWKSYNDEIEGKNFGNNKFLVNEKRLDKLEISDTQRENLLEQRLENIIKGNNENGEENGEVNDDNDDDNDENVQEIVNEQPIIEGKKYEKINISQESFITKIENMINIIDKYDSNNDKIIDEETILDGLKYEDYSTVRDFKNKRA